MTGNDWAVIKKDHWSDLAMFPRTRRCLVCDKLENPDAHVVYDVGWLCPECKKKLRDLIK